MSVVKLLTELGTVTVHYSASLDGDGWNEPRTFELDIDTIMVNSRAVDLDEPTVLEALADYFSCQPADVPYELDQYIAERAQTTRNPAYDEFLALRGFLD
jgi:hypothetical protein